MLAALFCSCLALTTFGFSIARYRRVCEDDGVVGLTERLRRRGSGGLNDLMTALSQAKEVAATRALDVLQAPTRALAGFELREALAEVGLLRRERGVITSLGRVALTAGTLGSVIEISQGLKAGQSPILWASVSFAGGFVVWIGASYLASACGRVAAARIEAWCELARHLERAVSAREPNSPFGADAGPLASSQSHSVERGPRAPGGREASE